MAPTRSGRSPGGATWTRATLLAAVGVTASGAVALHLFGRRLWCACASASPWSWDIWSPHNSQHLVDPYTLTHVMHGLLAYAGLRWLAGPRWPAARALVAIVAEVAWEVVENTDRVIEAYRESTIALNYVGDSIVNSLGDVAAFALGYALAGSLPAWISSVAFLGTEAVLLLTIRDSLLLNVLMLLRPIAAIKTWQMGG
jgi:hypothetical protein